MSQHLAATRLIGALLDHPGEMHRMAPVLEAEAMPPGLPRDAYSFLLRRHAHGGSSQPPVEPEELIEALAVGSGNRHEAVQSWVLHEVCTQRALPETIKARAEEVRRRSYGARLVSSLRDAAGMAETCLASGSTYAEVRDEALRLLAASGEAARAVKGATALEANEALLRRMEEAQKAGGLTGFTWNLPSLDKAMNGLRPGQLTAVGARMKVGKTHLAIHLVEEVAGREWIHLGRQASVLFFTFEMDEAECRQRALAWHTGIPSHELGRGQLCKDKWGRLHEAIEQTNTHDIHYVTERGLTIEGIVDVTRARASEGPVDLIVVDYLDLVRRPRSQRDDLEIGRVVRGLLELGGETQAHVLLIVQLNREGTSTPRVEHLAGSDEIARAAHHILLLEKQEKEYSILGRRTDRADEAQLRVHLTSRGPGTGDAFDVLVNYATSCFEELERGRIQTGWQ